MSELDAAFGVALDPFKPKDLILPPGLATTPPTCPTCGAFLHAVDHNPAGDVFFECLNGDLQSAGHYSAVYRVERAFWDQHPAFKRDDWIAPGTAKKPALVAKPTVAATPANVVKLKNAGPSFAERMRKARDAKAAKAKGKRKAK